MEGQSTADGGDLPKQHLQNAVAPQVLQQQGCVFGHTAPFGHAHMVLLIWTRSMSRRGALLFIVATCLIAWARRRTAVTCRP